VGFKVILHLWRASKIYCSAVSDSETGRLGAFPEVSEVWTLELASAEAIFFGSAPSDVESRKVLLCAVLSIPELTFSNK
jgi:hypothetical protein